MANSLAGFLAVYAKESLPQLIADSPIFSSFTTDFSADAAQGGASVITRLPSTTYSLNDTAANGYTPLAASASAVTVTMKQRDITHQFSELDWGNDPTRVYNTFVPAMVQGFINGVSVDVMGLITAANYSTTISSSATAFSASALIRAGQLLSTNSVPADNRTCVLLPTYFENVLNSNNMLAYAIGNSDAATARKINAYAGFSPVVEFASIPALTDTLSGFAAHKSAIAIATRMPQTLASYPGQISVLTDAKSGLSIQFREWHDVKYGPTLSATLIYGAAKGNGNALVRIKP